MMSPVLIAAAVVLTSVLVAFAVIFVRMTRQRTSHDIDGHWLANFTPSRYRPMERLLAEEEFAFLAAQPGFTRDMRRRFRTERRRVFRSYLRNLARDFERLHRAARVLMLSAPEDRPDFAAALVRQRFLFERGLMLVRYRLMVNWISGAEVNVSGLVDALDAVNAQVRVLAASPAAA
jgi:hypothetical protein